MRKGGSTRLLVGLVVVALAAVGAGLGLRATGLLGWLERPSVDARFALRGSHGAPGDVVVVGFDNNSLGSFPHLEAVSRRLDAEVLEHLHDAGARLIVYDIALNGRTSRPADEALFEAAEEAAPVVFGTSLITRSGQTELLHAGNAKLASIGDEAAAMDFLPDPDGVIRHTLARRHHLPTIAAAVSRRLGRAGADGGQLEGGWIDFAGPPGTVPQISFLSVLHNHFDRASVRGKVVVIGATAPVLQDVHATAVGGQMPGPELQADAIATALAGFPLRNAPGAVTVLLIVGLGLLAPLVAMRLETLGVILLGVGAAVLWTLAAQIAFDSGSVLDYSDPLAALVLGASGAAILGMWSESRERRRLRMLFATGRSGFVEEVLNAPGTRELEPTAIIAGYRLEHVVGRGGMGIVYSARQLALDRPVALKLIAAEHAHNAVYRERFVHESRIAASIEHTNVIPVYEAGEDEGLLFIAMRLVEGCDLARLLAGAGPLEPARTAWIIAQAAAALDAAHARGLVHRDVKPANILLTLDEPEHVYLTDFGVAKRVGALTRITAAGGLLGTLDYVAPEQIRGEELDGLADVYALAGVLYTCLTANTPFPRESEAATLWSHLSAPPPAPTSLRADLPAAFDAVVARGMAKLPEERFASCAALAHACAQAVGLSGIELPASTPKRRHEQHDTDATPTLLSE